MLLQMNCANRLEKPVCWPQIIAAHGAVPPLAFFREALTFLAVLIIVALSAALAIPHVVDWTARRGWVESILSQALGARVEVAGAIDVKLLPSPILDLGQVSVRGLSPGDPQMFAQRLRLEMAPAPLLRGAVRFVEARLDQPRVTLSLSEDGAFALPRPPANAPEELAFERIEVHGGQIEITRPGRERLLLGDVTMNAEAASLQGPFKGAGSLRTGGQALAFRFGTGASEDGRLRLKVSVDGAALAPHIEFDGALGAQAMGLNTRLRLEGAAVLSGRVSAGGVTLPWRAAGLAQIEPGRASLNALELRLGEEERSASLAGAAHYDEASGLASLKLNAPRLDLDRLIAQEGPDSKQPIALAGRALADALASRYTAGDWPFELEFATPALQIGGETLGDVRLRFDSRSGDALTGSALAVKANLPGRSHLSLDGKIESGLAAQFSGALSASARDLPRLADWVGRVDGDLAERLRAMPFRAIDIEGKVELSHAAIAARELVVKADRSTFTGAAAFTRAFGAERARLFADLTSSALDIEGLPDLTGPARAAAGVDLNLVFDARAVRVARIGEGMVDSGRISAKVLRQGDLLQLERLSIQNVGGANLQASGQADSSGARIELALDAQRLGELAALLRRIAPGRVADLISERATALSPARVKFEAQAAPDSGGFALRSLKIDGSARGTRIVGAVAPDGARIDGELEFTSADASMLLRQFGFDAAPVPGLPRARVIVRGQGGPAEGYGLNISGDVAGSGIAFEGRVNTQGEHLSSVGKARVRAADSGPLLRTLGLAAPDLTGAAPMDLSANTDLRDGRLEFSDLSGNVLGSGVSGALRLARPAGGGRLALNGSLLVDKLSLSSLTGFALGASTSPKTGALWSEQMFAPAPTHPFSSSIDLRIGAFDVRGAGGQEASMRLSIVPGQVNLEDMSLRIGQASLAGRVSLRRDKGVGSLSGRLDFDAPTGGRAGLEGRIAGSVEIAGAGASESALIASLAGGGETRLYDARVLRTDSGALDRVIEAAEKDALIVDEANVVAALGRELERGFLIVPQARFETLIASGVARLQPGAIEGGSGAAASARAWGMLDLRDQRLDAGVEISSRTPPPNWSGASPRIRVTWSGPLEKPVRGIEAGALVNTLSTRAIVRESARIAAMEADMRERAAFNRRWKAQEWLRVRVVEIEAFKREEARRIEEAKRLEEARLRREQELQNAQSAKAASDALKALIQRSLEEPVTGLSGSGLPGSGLPMNISPN